MPARTIADRYELEQPLGGGAMSAVWLAQDRELERKVAVKLLANDADRTRFEREARAVAALSHPNICQLYDYGEADDGPYMILEYLPGGTLEDRLAGGEPLPDEETARIAREVAAGLAHAHERSLVHRDLKPANILFDAEDRAKIADFGIARIAGAGVLTQAGTVLGTAAYISPEQASGEPATPASDVYSFGTILYRMLTGRTPFVADSAMELVRMHRDEEPPPVERYRADAPAALAAVAFASLAKAPGDRPADGDVLLTELAPEGEDATTLLAAAPAAAFEAAAQTPPTHVIPRAPRRRGRRATLLPLAIAAIALLAAAGVGAAYVLTGDGGGSGRTPPPTLQLPSVGTDSTSTVAPTTAETTVAPTTETEPETTQPTTTEPTSTKKTTTTRQTSTRTTSTRETTTAPPPPTTAPTTAPTTEPETTTTTTTTTAATTTTTTAAATATTATTAAAA